VYFGIDEGVPTWVRSLESMRYLSARGGGGRVQVYYISEKGKEAVVAHKMSQG